MFVDYSFNQRIRSQKKLSTCRYTMHHMLLEDLMRFCMLCCYDCVLHLFLNFVTQALYFLCTWPVLDGTCHLCKRGDLNPIFSVATRYSPLQQSEPKQNLRPTGYLFLKSIDMRWNFPMLYFKLCAMNIHILLCVMDIMPNNNFFWPC